jgi:DNA-binding response OmpR family regulator
MPSRRSAFRHECSPGAKLRVLCVDDEPALKDIIATILESEGFEAVTAGTVTEALACINGQHFDLLVSDMNLGELSDGFTVVSAMKRSQPRCRTLILTGYPDYDAALAHLRSQADRFLTKPVRRQALLEAVRSLFTAAPAASGTRARLPDIVRQNKEELMRRWQRELNSRSAPAQLAPAENGGAGELPMVIDEIVNALESGQQEPEGDYQFCQDTLPSATRHGRLRRQQGCPLELMLLETRILQREMFRLIFEHLLDLDMSYIFRELAIAADAIAALAAGSIAAYIDTRDET